MNKYSKQELETYILKDKLSYAAIGGISGVTGAAIKKAALRYGIILPKKRTINAKENFSHKGKSKVDSFSDSEFIEIISSNIGWKNIGSALGYTNRPSSDVVSNIKSRCSKLGIEPIIEQPSPILFKTKGELLSSRKNYQSYRSSIRKHAELTYFRSTKVKKCAICGYDKHIEIAHIKSVAEFDDSVTIAEINSIDNLIALCPNHHWEYDNGLITI